MSATYPQLDQVGDSKVDSFVKYDTPDEVNAFLDTFYKHGGRHLDTSRNYSPSAHGSSEPRLGAVGAGSRFNIDTKILGVPGSGPFHTAQQIKSSIDASVADLKLPDGVKIDIMYLHLPDRDTPLEETCEAMNQAYQEGKFKRFGISNYTADEVERIVAICKDKGYVAPAVYQGQYNPLVRSGEDVLFPVLRKHGIAFYAYSPAAAGVFVGNQKKAQSGSRFDPSVSGSPPPYCYAQVVADQTCPWPARGGPALCGELLQAQDRDCCGSHYRSSSQARHQWPRGCSQMDHLPRHPGSCKGRRGDHRRV